jgi:hypothetical protein
MLPSCSELAREFGAQEKDLRRVIHPQQQRNQRAGRAIAAGHAAVADVRADRIFPQREHEGRAHGADLTSCHDSRTRGSILKITANSAAITAKPISVEHGQQHAASRHTLPQYFPAWPWPR